ncbi:LysR family transcriptional regulator [Ferrimonas balearica]|nr:LysR family transcriptional regulator [Ferrimonas balearica]MBY5993601.1 LysR family transcriptional regulator [Ferrimonas balearica]
MNLKTLECFLTLAQTASFTRTAERMHLTQPTISKMMQKLETEVGQPLLVRGRQGLGLTEAGQRMQQRAERMVIQWQHLQREMQALDRLEQGTLRLGLCPMVSPLAAPLLRRYLGEHPGVELALTEDGGYGCEKALLNDRLEISFTALPTTHQGEFEQQALVRYPLTVCLPPDHPLAAKSALGWADLTGEPVILYNEDFALAQWLTRLSQRQGVELEVVLRSGQWDFIGAMVGSGLGLAILPQPICDRLPTGQVVQRPLAPALDWAIGLIWRRDTPLSPAAQAFLTLAQSMMGAAARPA